MKRHLQTFAAALLLCTFAVAQSVPARGRFAAPGTSTSDIIAAAGWTYDGTQALATKDASIPEGNVLYLDGPTRATGIKLSSSVVRVVGAFPLAPNSDQAINLGTTALRWSNLYIGEINMGASSARTWIASAPTAPVACTSPTITHGNAISFQADVGSTCAGISTFAFTVPAATNGWSCQGYNKTTSATAKLEQTADTTTSVTMTNYTRTTGLALAFADGADLVISCTAR